MSSMWRFMATDPTDFRRIPPPTRNLPSITRKATCLIFIILITSILTVASAYEHFTNICIGLLLILMMFFIVFSITMVKTSLMRNDVTQHAGMSDSIWTTVADIQNIRAHIDEHLLRDPPSYDSVMQDSKYFFPSPPPYSSIVCTPGHTLLNAPNMPADSTCVKVKDHIIIDVTKLSDSCTTST